MIPESVRCGKARSLFRVKRGDELYGGDPSRITPGARLSFARKQDVRDSFQPTLHLSEELLANHINIFGYVGHIKQLDRADI